MKKLTHLLFALFITIYSYSPVKTNRTLLVNIPDNNFEYYLETYNINGEEVDITSSNNMGDGIVNNGKVPILRINKVSKLDLSNLKINTIQGIEHFHLLTQLNVSNNNIKEIDVSKNDGLEWLFCLDNKLKVLNITSNKSLDRLFCANNNLNTLNTSKNKALDYLDCSNNSIDNLDLSNNKSLDRLNCSNNKIKTIDLSTNTSLDRIDISNNSLEKLILTKKQIKRKLSR